MLSSIISWFKNKFIKEQLGILLKKFIKNASQNLSNEFLNSENQQKAYEYAKELFNNKEMSGSEKAKEFNRKMKEWASKCGKIIGDSMINLLREIAVDVIKNELRK